jgi:hypothetical protein
MERPMTGRVERTDAGNAGRDSALWIGVYGLSITSAGTITAAYSVPAGLFRFYGGVLADRHGARRVVRTRRDLRAGRHRPMQRREPAE